MMQKFKISWFHREAGLLFHIRTVRNACCPLFFTVVLILLLTLTGVFGLLQDAVPIVYAVETTEAAEAPPEQPDIRGDETKSVVVVIDPGHGGDNLGGEYEDYTEKEMTLIVAKAMKEELEQYEGITVYLTRTDDRALTLEQRCEYAQSVGADFLFCLHFNMSVYHTLFGAETWVSAFGEQYSKGVEFARIEMELLQEMGLYSRGIKTRLNDAGIDYYGIIRHSTERNIPCVLIEHCHLDQENDQPFYDHKEKLEAFGRLDAEAVAKYYGLRSESLGKDFSSYVSTPVPVPTQIMAPDRTEPEICMIDLTDQNMRTGDISISVSAADYDSGMLYYTYSYDGGQTFSELQRWPDKSKDTFELTITVPSGIVPQIVVNAYNGYDLYTTSNTLNLPSMSYGTEAEDADTTKKTSPLQDTQISEEIQASAAGKGTAVETVSGKVLPEAEYREVNPVSTQNAEPQQATFGYFLKVCLICAVLVLAMIFSMIIILRSYKKRHRRRYR